MSISDPLIIYLAIGSPLAVYHFLRTSPAYSLRDLPRAILVWLFWPIYTFWLLRQPRTPEHSRTVYSPDYATLDASTAKRVDEIRVEMEKIFCQERRDRSLFDFREVFERYVGLTSETLVDEAGPLSPFGELTSGDGQNAKLNAICINRRNRRHLEFHQIRARNDFLTLVSGDGIGQNDELTRLAVELSTLLLDSEGLEALKINDFAGEQSEAKPSVIDLESEVWPSKAHRQSIAGQA